MSKAFFETTDQSEEYIVADKNHDGVLRVASINDIYAKFDIPIKVIIDVLEYKGYTITTPPQEDGNDEQD